MRSRRTPANQKRLRYMEEELARRRGFVTATSIDRVTQSVAAEIINEDYLKWDPEKRKEAAQASVGDVRQRLGGRLDRLDCAALCCVEGPCLCSPGPARRNSPASRPDRRARRRRP